MPLPNSHDIIKRIVGNLFTAEERRLAGLVQRMIRANAEFYPNRPHDGFTYMGKPYDVENLGRGARTRVSLHIDLVDRMDELLKDQEQVWSDRWYISQMLHTLMQPCNSLQDLRDVLPNCIVDTLDELKGLPRIQPEAFTILSNTRTFRQYLKVLPRIEFYATSRLLY